MCIQNIFFMAFNIYKLNGKPVFLVNDRNVKLGFLFTKTHPSSLLKAFHASPSLCNTCKIDFFAASVCPCSTVDQCVHVKPTARCEFGCPCSCMGPPHPKVPFGNTRTSTYLQCEAVSVRVLYYYGTNDDISVLFKAKKCQEGWRSYAGPSARRGELFCLNTTKMSPKC